MRRWVRKGRLGLAIASVSVLGVGLATDAGAKSGATKPTLTIGGDRYCQTITPFGGQGWDVFFMNLPYEYLIKYNSAGRYVPGLALSWRIHPGNKVATVNLRRNARFSDGAPLDAEAVKASMAVVQQQPVGNLLLGPVRTVEVLSKYVVRITLKTPNPNFVYGLSSRATWLGSGPLISPRAIAQAKADAKNPPWNKRTLGAGPYTMVPSQSVINDHCTYVPNRYYYDKSKQKWGKIVFKSILEPNALLAAMRTGQVDVGDGFIQLADAARAAGLEVHSTLNDLSNGFYFLDLDGKLNPALADVRVRQAMNYAVDRKTIARALFGRYATPTSSPYPGDPANDPKYFNYYTYNPAKARSLLAAAGYANGLTIKALVGGRSFQDSYYRTTAWTEAAAKNLAAVGIKLDITNPLTGQEMGDAYGSKAYSIYGGPGGGFSDVYAQYTFRKDMQQHGFRDPVMDRLYYRGIRTSGKKAFSLKRQVITRSITRAYYIHMFATGTFTFVGNRVANFHRKQELAYSPTDWSPAK